MKRDQLDRIEILLERLDAAVVVKDPGNARSAEAFDGLRKLMIQSGTSRRAHVSHLLSLSDSIERNASMDLLRDRVGDFLLELGIRRTSDVSQPELFEIVEGEGSALECIVPAVIERFEDGRTNLVRHGKARRVPAPDPSVEGTSDGEGVAAAEDAPLASDSEVPHSAVSTSSPSTRSIALPVVVAVSLTATAIGLLIGIII
jgi:hypothetical protein